jgi:hypothetical protein
MDAVHLSQTVRPEEKGATAATVGALASLMWMSRMQGRPSSRHVSNQYMIGYNHCVAHAFLQQKIVSSIDTVLSVGRMSDDRQSRHELDVVGIGHYE